MKNSHQNYVIQYRLQDYWLDFDEFLIDKKSLLLAFRSPRARGIVAGRAKLD